MDIAAIVRAFQSNANINTDNEVELFRKLSKAICDGSRSLFIDETHGNVAKVKFDSIINGSDQCEISDLLIVIKDGQSGRYRATFWQAKREKSSKWKDVAGQNNFDFHGQFNQWELLSYRPHIEGVGNFSPPSDLLSDASSPSISSFGVFHELNGNVEVNYSVAEMVVSSSISKTPKMVINEKLSGYIAWDRESIVKQDLRSFLEAIKGFSIGAIINPETRAGEWMLNYIASKCNSRGFNDFIDQSNMENVPAEDGVSVLFINNEKK